MNQKNEDTQEKVVLKQRPLAENAILSEDAKPEKTQDAKPVSEESDHVTHTEPKPPSENHQPQDPNTQHSTPSKEASEPSSEAPPTIPTTHHDGTEHLSEPENSPSQKQDTTTPKPDETKEEPPKPSEKTEAETPHGEQIKTKGKGKRVTWYTIGVGPDKTYFIENLAMLLVSGMSIITALDSIKSGLKSKRMREIVEGLKVEVDEGVPVWEALDHTGLLSSHAVALIKIGEKSGRLSANLKVIATQEQKEKIFKSKVTSALMYPAIVLFFTLVVGIGIAWFVLPKLSGVFKSLDVKLPVTTKLLLSFGEFLGKNGTVVVPIFLAVLFTIFYFVFFFPKTKFIGQKITFHIPGISVLTQQIELSRFGFILGTLLSAGMPLVNALASLEEISNFRDYKRFYLFLSHNIEEGNSFQKCFAAYKGSNRLIPFPVQQMIVASEQSGNLKKTLAAIGENFEEKTDISTKNLSVALEPILLFIIWAVVVFVALSVIMPIYSLIGGFNP